MLLLGLSVCEMSPSAQYGHCTPNCSDSNEVCPAGSALAMIWSTEGPLASWVGAAIAVPVHRLHMQRSCSPAPLVGA